MITPTAMNPALTTRLSLMRVPPMRTWARRLARGPDDMRVGSAAHVHVEGFTCVSRGLRAYRGVYEHTQGLTCERTMWLSGRYHPGRTPDTRASNPYPRNLPKMQTTSSLAAHCQRFSPSWSALSALRLSGRPLDGGNCAIQGSDTPATRRCSASHGAKAPLLPVSGRCRDGRARQYGTVTRNNTNARPQNPDT